MQAFDLYQTLEVGVPITGVQIRELTCLAPLLPKCLGLRGDGVIVV